MSQASKARIKAAEKAYWAQRRREAPARLVHKYQQIVQQAITGWSKEDIAADHQMQIGSKNNALNTLWRNPMFKEWVTAAQADLDEQTQAAYIEEKSKYKIITKMEMLETYSTQFNDLAASNDPQNLVKVGKELALMMGLYAPTKTETKDTTESMDDDDLHAEYAAIIGRLSPAKH